MATHGPRCSPFASIWRDWAGQVSARVSLSTGVDPGPAQVAHGVTGVRQHGAKILRLGHVKKLEAEKKPLGVDHAKGNTPWTRFLRAGRTAG